MKSLSVNFQPDGKKLKKSNFDKFISVQFMFIYRSLQDNLTNLTGLFTIFLDPLSVTSSFVPSPFALLG